MITFLLNRVEHEIILLPRLAIFKINFFFTEGLPIQHLTHSTIILEKVYVQFAKSKTFLYTCVNLLTNKYLVTGAVDILRFPHMTSVRYLFDLLFYVPVNSYGHDETVISSQHIFFLGKLG